jgi:hypothetical protein
VHNLKKQTQFAFARVSRIRRCKMLPPNLS